MFPERTLGRAVSGTIKAGSYWGKEAELGPVPQKGNLKRV